MLRFQQVVFAKSRREPSTKQAKNVNPHLVGFADTVPDDDARGIEPPRQKLQCSLRPEAVAMAAFVPTPALAPSTADPVVLPRPHPSSAAPAAAFAFACCHSRQQRGRAAARARGGEEATSTGPTLAPEDQWISSLDLESFGKEVHELGERLKAQQDQEDVKHLHKIQLWSRLCAVLGLGTMWMRVQTRCR
ncbi:unnamed protein product [Effrenium voratum]|nr:unnamed protein product [Effrenium voratum]